MSNYEEVSGGSVTFWSPKEPETIEGLLLERKEGVGNFNSIGYVLAEPGSEERIMVTANAMLDDMLKKVPIGYMVRIDFLGYKLAKSGNQFKNFRVFKKPAEMVQVPSTNNAPTQPTQNASIPQPSFNQGVQQAPAPSVNKVPPPIAPAGGSLLHIKGNIHKNASGILVDANGNFVNHLGLPSPVPIRYEDVKQMLGFDSGSSQGAVGESEEVPF